MKLYRIYTEDVNREWIKDTLKEYFEGFTIIESTGCWDKKEEKALIIELATDLRALVYIVADKIKHHNKQDCVLVTSTIVDEDYI